MADEVWYYLENRQQRGPVSFEELQGLVQAGTVQPNDMVWSPDMSEWAPASTVPDLVPPGTASAPPPPPEVGRSGPSFAERSRSLFEGAAHRADSLPHVTGIDKLLDGMRGWLHRERLDGWDRIGRVVGHWTFLLAALFLAVIWAYLGIREEVGRWIVHGLIGVPLIAVVLHYVAVRFLDADRDLLGRTPTRLASSAFSRCVGLLLALGSLASVVMALYVLFDDGDVVDFGIWLAVAAVLLYAAGAALSLDSLNVELVETTGAGEEAVGVLGFLFKLPLRLVPILFGAFAVAGLIFVVYTLIDVLDGDSVRPWEPEVLSLFFINPAARLVTSFLRGSEVLMVALIPLVIYLYFLVYYLFLALAKAILGLSARPSSLHGEESQEQKV